jgi:serine/threonine protein kinase
MKPQNILLRLDPYEPHGIGAKVTDFGLSKEAPGDSASLTDSQRESKGWTAPEILMAEAKDRIVC